MNNELLQMYQNLEFKTESLGSTRTELHHTQDELTSAQNYIQHLEIELEETDQ
jgi:hypothetical protein